jgi:cytochrome c oxidase cbb3-type subunit I
MQLENSQAITYYDKVIRQFSIMAVVWGVVGMLMGVVIAAQLVWPELNLRVTMDQLWSFKTIAYQCSDFCIWWLCIVCYLLLCSSAYLSNLACLPRSWLILPSGAGKRDCAAAITLPLGYTQGKEYAELEWPIDILIALVWVAYAIVFLRYDC